MKSDITVRSEVQNSQVYKLKAGFSYFYFVSILYLPSSTFLLSLHFTPSLQTQSVFYTQSAAVCCLRFTPKTSFEKNCFSAWASTLNMGLINKVDMVCLSPVGYGV